MIGNFLLTSLYLCAGVYLAFMAWTGLSKFPATVLWVGAGICLIVGFWRLLHLSKS